jgi:hypothetical protein
MNAKRFHERWVEQCDAAEAIKSRYGAEGAFDYLVSEKLLNFACAAGEDPDFARELPQFVSRVRRIFTAEEMRIHIARLERFMWEHNRDSAEEDDEFADSAETIGNAAARFAVIKELLTAPELGTS